MQYFDDSDLELFRLKIQRLTGIDLGQYRAQQMQRRLKGLLDRAKIAGLADYARVLERDPRELQRFKDFLTINVSEFFRNPDRFDELENTILPRLIAASSGLSVWSAGCSNGAEIYSVAIILDEMPGRRRDWLLATDIDATILERARQGVYRPSELRNVSKDRLDRYFFFDGSSYHIADRIKSKVEFRQHNLLSDPFSSGFDLILCRNVVIYFTEPAKNALFRRFRESLKHQGILFVGGTESVFNWRELGLAPFSPFFYQRV